MAYRMKWGSLSPLQRLHQESVYTRWQAARLQGSKADLDKFFLYPKPEVEQFDEVEPTVEFVAAAFMALPGGRTFKRSPD